MREHRLFFQHIVLCLFCFLPGNCSGFLLGGSSVLSLHRVVAVLLVSVWSICVAGCGGDPNANNPELTPELQEKIKAEDADVDAAEGGKGSVRGE